MSQINMSYAEKLKDPRWQKMRLKVLERDEWKCRECGDSNSTLHVHHLIYFPGREPWEYNDNLLITLCEECHKEVNDCFIDYLEIFLVEYLNKFDGDHFIDFAFAISCLEFPDLPFVSNSKKMWMSMVVLKDLLSEFPAHFYNFMEYSKYKHIAKYCLKFDKEKPECSPSNNQGVGNNV